MPISYGYGAELLSFLYFLSDTLGQVTHSGSSTLLLYRRYLSQIILIYAMLAAAVVEDHCHNYINLWPNYYFRGKCDYNVLSTLSIFYRISQHEGYINYSIIHDIHDSMIVESQSWPALPIPSLLLSMVMLSWYLKYKRFDDFPASSSFYRAPQKTFM